MTYAKLCLNKTQNFSHKFHGQMKLKFVWLLCPMPCLVKNKAETHHTHCQAQQWWRDDLGLFCSYRTWIPDLLSLSWSGTLLYTRVLYRKMWGHPSDSYSLVNAGSCSRTMIQGSPANLHQNCRKVRESRFRNVQSSTRLKCCGRTSREPCMSKYPKNLNEVKQWC